MEQKSPSAPARTPSPSEIASSLGARVIGQEQAVREMSVALAKYLAGLRSGNLLLIGPSGTGKTTVMRSVESYLSSHPSLAKRATVVRFHAQVLAEAAEQGRPGEVVLRRLLDRAADELGRDADLEHLLARVRRGLVFVDEVDKIRSKVGGETNRSGIRAQEALLTVIENESVPFDLPAWAGGGTVRVDTSGVLFVAGGAFEGLYDDVFDRVTIGDDKGSLQTVTVVEGGRVREELHFQLRDWLRTEDLFNYGMSPQFLSRFDSVVLLQDLGPDALVKIFLEGADSGLREAQRYFASQGVHLAVSPAAIRRVAVEAARRPRMGARALREVFHRVIRGYEFDPGAAVSGAGGALMLDEAEVERALADPGASAGESGGIT
ncbi:MAG: AAA family ATPase [Acidobacteriota bacterium]